MKFNPQDYTCDALSVSPDWKSPTSPLAYAVGLVDSVDSGILEPRAASFQVLSQMYEMEGISSSPRALLGNQEQFLPPGYFPQTPVMVTVNWSPITLMLERGFEPLVLKRANLGGGRDVAVGIWRPMEIAETKRLDECTTFEELFWFIMKEASARARHRGKLVSITAKPGFSYKDSIGSLPNWSERKLKAADRILWRRTPEEPRHWLSRWGW